ncbi:MAG: DUF1015 domain-containing protein [Candidatus Omnitrophota bacterium]|nr:DUF1015 domain-containing protein [Candidatus Omnitrophota bacterium]
MPSIRPFKAVIYNRKKIKNISKVLAPPYDVIPPDMRDELYRRHKNNVVRLILGKINKSDTEIDNRYTRAAADFESWLNEGILVKKSSPAIYIYSQGYKYDNKAIERVGFISLMELDLEDKKVLPHEKTLKAPKEDRLRLMRRAKANLSPIFMLYEDARHKVNGILKSYSKKTAPFIDVNIDNVRHRVWAFTDKAAIRKIEGVMSKKDIFIADGHHRYETSKNYARELIASDASQSLIDSSKFFMAYFVELEERSLSILPTHRLIKDVSGLGREEIVERLEKYFVVEKVSSPNKLLKKLGALKAHHAFGMCLTVPHTRAKRVVRGKKCFYVLKLKDFEKAKTFMGDGSADWKSLDVSILHLFVLKHVLGISDEDDNIEFVKDPRDAFKVINSGGARIAFFLNPTKVTQVKKVAQSGEKMPRKATYFYPKPLSGLVINKF